MKHTQTLLVALFTFACGGQATEESQPATGSGSAAQPVTATPPTPPPPPVPAALTMVSHDLSSADPAWAGWTAQGPEGCRVMQDGVHAARIACNGSDGWDMSFAPRHRNLRQIRESLETGARASNGAMTLNFIVATEDRLEWTTTGYGSTNWNFIINTRVGRQDFACSNNYMMGIGTEALFNQHKAACETLTPPAR